jgi:hypothetical protein
MPPPPTVVRTGLVQGWLAGFVVQSRRCRGHRLSCADWPLGRRGSRRQWERAWPKDCGGQEARRNMASTANGLLTDPLARRLTRQDMYSVSANKSAGQRPFCRTAQHRAVWALSVFESPLRHHIALSGAQASALGRRTRVRCHGTSRRRGGRLNARGAMVAATDVSTGG